MTKPPKDLGRSGKALWSELARSFDVTDTEPLLGELCRIQDRLSQVRAVLAKEGLMPGGKKHPLADLEPKLSAQFQKLWKLAGFADPDPTSHRGPGRPPGS